MGKQRLFEILPEKCRLKEWSGVGDGVRNPGVRAQEDSVVDP